MLCDVAALAAADEGAVTLAAALPVAPALALGALVDAAGNATSASAAQCEALAGTRRQRLLAPVGAPALCSVPSTASATLPLLVISVQVRLRSRDSVGDIAAALASARAGSFALSSKVWSAINCATFPDSPFAVTNVTAQGGVAKLAPAAAGLSASQQLGIGLGVGLGLAALLALGWLCCCRASACAGRGAQPRQLLIVSRADAAGKGGAAGAHATV